MSRSLKKGPFCDPKLISKVAEGKVTAGKGGAVKVKVYSRASTILPEFVGVTFEVHNGRKFIEVYVTEEMVGHKLGEFASSTVFKGHGGKIAKGKK